MSINVNDKNLGHATAYAYYKAGGGTMTEAEFTEFMADFGTASQTAVEAAQTALASKNAAQTAATTATDKASEATTAATTATTKAAEAQADADAAALDASQALSAASTATTKATEATTAAATATSAATTATTAKDDAVSAKTAAQTAQTGAETAAASVEASAEQIATNAEDISQLKSDLTALAPKEDMLKAFPVDTASGSIASFSDGAELPLKSLTVDIEPIQDLHGYDNPWPAGGGKNKFFISASRDAYSWSDGCGFAAITAGDSSITFNGTASASHAFTVSGAALTLPAGTYTMSISVPDKIQFILRKSDTQVGIAGTLSNTSFTLTEETTIDINFMIVSGASFSNQSIGFQIESGSTATAYAPYENICPISGRTQAVVTRTGVNVWDEERELGIYGLSDGLPAPNASSIRGKNRIVAKPSTDYYCNNNNIRVLYYDESDNYLGFVGGLGIKTTPTNCAYIRMYLSNDYGTTYNHDISINYPSTDHDYHPYSGQSITIDLGQTVYGGTLDVLSGELVIDRAMVDLGTLTWSKTSTTSGKWRFQATKSDITIATRGGVIPNMICEIYKAVSPDDTYVGVTGISNNINIHNVFICDLSISEVSDLVNVINGKKVVYPLATPITVQLTPHEVTALLGSNNVWADTGDSAVEYRADPTLYIQRLTEPDADMVADANIVSGQYFMVGNTLYKATANIASGATISPNVNCTRKSLSEALNELNA
jgi:hypothetical protein